LAASTNNEHLDASSPSIDWLSIAAFQRDGGGLDCLPNLETQGEQSLHGHVPLVIGGRENSRLVCAAIDSDSQPKLLLVTLNDNVKRNAVHSLGLPDAGLANIDFSVGSTVQNVVISKHLATIQRTRISALKSALPAYAAICRAIFLNCYAMAKTHAESRYQGGGFIASLPQIREKLRVIERSIAFAKLVEHATPDDYVDPEELLVPLRKALLRSTDAAIQVLGGAGYVSDGGLTAHWRDARQLAALFGSNLGALA
jgi:alkylation response protein AidB-like acyl-CoA dehydrogenase